MILLLHLSEPAFFSFFFLSFFFFLFLFLFFFFLPLLIFDYLNSGVLSLCADSLLDCFYITTAPLPGNWLPALPYL